VDPGAEHHGCIRSYKSGTLRDGLSAKLRSGVTWTAKSLGAGLLEPQTGPLLKQSGSTDVLQVIKIYGALPQEVPELKLYVYHPGSTGSVISDVRSTGLPLPLALPGASFGRDGQLWVASEEANATGGARWSWRAPRMRV
jgi:hypothetical protein